MLNDEVTFCSHEGAKARLRLAGEETIQVELKHHRALTLTHTAPANPPIHPISLSVENWKKDLTER